MRYLFSNKNMLFCPFVVIFLWGCKQGAKTVPSSYKYLIPKYTEIQLTITSDTVNFKLDSSTFAAIKSFNIFSHKGVECVSFYDERSQSVNIYKFQTQQFIKKIKLKKWLNSNTLYKTSVFIKNFDSIFINNQTTLYLFDRFGDIKKSINFLERPAFAWAIFENTSQPVFKNNQVFAAVRPYVNDASIDDLKKWKVVYGFDFQNNKAQLYYNLPAMYQYSLYGDHFLDYNFCLNNKENFVFSFPADTNIYESNLSDYHVAYYAKSLFQQKPITPLTIADLKEDEIKFKQYKIREAYGSIFFDPFKKRYLRLAKQKIDEADYDAKNRDRKQSIIIFDENFRIIAESEVPTNLAFNTLIFSSTGSMYIRVNSSDENALHFARLAYIEKNDAALKQLTNLKTKSIK